MAILRPEPDMFPADLLSAETTQQDHRSWWVFRTRAQQAKALARDLLQRNVPFYLPQVPHVHVYKGRKRNSFVPLFGNYIFVCATEEERIRALSTNRSPQTILVSDQQELVHDLRQIQRMIAAQIPLTVESRLAPGRRVRVRSGSLLGVEGIVHARSKTTKLVVLVRFLQQGVSLEIDDFLLEAID